MKNLLFIVNPISGIGKQKRIEKVLNTNLDLEKFTFEVAYTERIHHGTEIARQAVEKGGYDAIIAVGGDGSVNDVVNGLKGSDMVMGIIPCGSGNGLARNLKIPLTPALAVKLINDFYVAPIDTIQLNDFTYVSIAGVGFDALVARRMKLAKTRGFQAYANIVLNDYPTSQETEYRMTIDGKDIKRKAWFISFANSNQFGFNTAVAPLAKLDDGLIDVCIIEKIPLAHIPLTAPLIYLNAFQYSQHVEIFKAKEVIVHNNNYKWVNIDGEGEKVGEELYFRNINKSLNIICRDPQMPPMKKVILDLEKDIERDFEKIKQTIRENH